MRVARTLLALSLSLCAASAHAAAANGVNVSITPSVQSPNLGKIATGTTPTVFHVDASTGAVSRVSGNAIRLATGPVTPPLVTLVCQNSACGTGTITVTVMPGLMTTGRLVSIASFSVSGLTGATIVSPPTGTAPMTFTISPVGLNGTASFRLGLDSRVSPNGSTGNSTWSYTVQALVN